MRVIADCWELMYACECEFGPYILENSTLKFYIYRGLSGALDKEIMDSFHVQQDEGFVGHCILVFYGVKSFHMSVSPYDWENGKVAWRTPIETLHESNIQGETITFGLAGRLLGFLTSVDIDIEAQKFEIHILEKDEPKKRP